MANIVEQRGFFWWLNDSNDQTNTEKTSIPGSLTISEEGHIQLNLDGTLWQAEPLEPLPWGTPRLLPYGKRITGRLGISGDYILLDGIEKTDFFLESEAPSTQSYEAKICLTGNSPFPSDFDFNKFHHLHIELVGLEAWLNLNSILVGDEEYGREDRVDAEVKVKFKNQRFFYKNDDADISIESMTMGAPVLRLGPEIPCNEVTFKQINYLTYTPTSESSLDSLQNDFIRIEEFFALLLGSYFHLDWPTLIRQVGDQPLWYRLYFFRGSVPEFKPSPYFIWTNFYSLKEDFGAMLSAWKAQAEQYGPGYYLYLASLRNPLPYHEHSFVNLIWALESLYKRRNSVSDETPSAIERKARIQSIIEKLSNADDDRDRMWFLERAGNYQKGPDLSDRIFDLLSKLPIAFDKEALRNFSMRCASRRNDISHEGGPREHETYGNFSEDISALTEALTYLYHGLLLNDIGLDKKLLLNTFTYCGLAEMRILPALHKVGLYIARVGNDFSKE
jgi:hypothetical protein